MMTRNVADHDVRPPLAMFVLAFFFVAVASYIVGLVGSSNSPVSGMTICTVLITAGLLLVLGYTGTAGMLATLGVAGVVCCAACTSGDICQDLKIGQIVGATPRRLQIGELIGTITAGLHHRAHDATAAQGLRHCRAGARACSGAQGAAGRHVREAGRRHLRRRTRHPLGPGRLGRAPWASWRS